MSSDLEIKLNRIEKKIDVLMNSQTIIRNMINNEPDNMISASKAAKMLGYSYGHFIHHIKQRIPHIHVGGKLMFAIKDVEAYKHSFSVSQAI